MYPAGVVEVLTAVDTPATGLGEALNALGPAFEAVVTAAQSPAIAEAVKGYFEEEEGPRIRGMSARIQAAVSGVGEATKAYLAGGY